MPEVDYAVPAYSPLVVSQEAVFNVSDLYKHIKAWFDFHGYDFYEKQYIDKDLEDGKEFKLKWVTEKKIDDYLRVHIDMTIKFEKVSSVKTKKGMMNKGKVTFKFESFLEKDWDDKWSRNFFYLFMRECYDKFVAGNYMDAKMEELRKQTYEVYNEVKAFLKLHQYKG